MKNIKLVIFCFVCIQLCIQSLYAQKPNTSDEKIIIGESSEANYGSISGIIVDKSNLQPIEYANILLMKVKDSSMAAGVITNEKGQFKLEKVPFDKYYLKITFIGYSNLIINNVEITKQNPDKKIGLIKFESSSKLLDEVNIIAEKKMMEYTLDKKVVNVDKNLVSSGGSAVDVMQNIPSVTVDIDGNVSLRGSTNVSILVDGRPSNISGTNRQAILEQIPASSIDAIEIITNPSAKYNPEGMSGIINIKLKKKTAKGLNGLASAGIGTGNRYNSSINLNYSTLKYNIFGSWDGRWFQGKGYGNTYREANIDDSVFYSYQHSDMKRNMNNNNIKLGFDWFLNNKNTISVSGQTGYDNSSREQFLLSKTNNNQNVFEDYYESTNIEDEIERMPSLNLSYKKTFEKKNEEFTIDISLNKANSEEKTNISNNIYITDYFNKTDSNSIQLQYNTGLNYNSQILVNYVYPFTDKMKLESGFQGNYRKIDNDYYVENYNFSSGKYFIDESSLNHFIYNENISALYGTISKEWDKLSVQLGLRLEQAFTKSEEKIQNQKYENSYYNLYPTIHISKKIFSKQEIQLSYSRRVNRPNIHDLNPFKDLTNPLVINYGNPYLKPEYINSFEFGHTKYWNKTSLYTSLYYRQINNVIKRIIYLGNDGISYITNENLSKGTSYGIDWILEQEIKKWWRINASFSYFRTIIEGNSIDGTISNDNYSWTSKLNSNITLLKNLNIQITANYRAPIVTPQGKMYETYSADIALKKDFLKDLFSVNFRVSDIFNTQRFDIDTYGTGFYSTMYRKRQSRMAFLTISYKINGGIKQKSRKKSESNNNSIDEGDF